MNHLVVPVSIGVYYVVLLNIGNDNNVVKFHNAHVVVSHCVLYSNTRECFNFYIILLYVDFYKTIHTQFINTKR